MVSFTEIAEMYPIMAFVPRDPICIVNESIWPQDTGTAYLCWVVIHDYYTVHCDRGEVCVYVSPGLASYIGWLYRFPCRHPARERFITTVRACHSTRAWPVRELRQ